MSQCYPTPRTINAPSAGINSGAPSDHDGSSVPADIDREGLKRLLEQGAQLVEVLPRDEFEDEHLPGALNIPLRRIDAEGPARLDRSRPVVVYCWDSA
jgi:phage shock protein E